MREQEDEDDDTWGCDDEEEEEHAVAVMAMEGVEEMYSVFRAEWRVEQQQQRYP
jgi:hypothetical protein